MARTGSCECGSVTYTIGGDHPIHVYACHCLDCQLRSGSAFAEHAMISAAAFVCEGALEANNRKLEGMQSEELFCAKCHTRMFNRNDAVPDMIFLRAGTLADRQQLEPMAHIWTKRKQRWVVLAPEVPAFEESPSPQEFGQAIAQAMGRMAAAD